MILRLVWRSIRFAPGRTLLMLGGYALGVGVMIALLSIGDAMVRQSQDRDLIGGGDLAVLPAGIDLETLRTGGVSSLHFDLDLARFFHREVLSGPRLAGPTGPIEAAAPWLDDVLLYARLGEPTESGTSGDAVESGDSVEAGDSAIAVSAGGQIPSAAVALGVAPDLRSGAWTDSEADRRWMSPSADERLIEADAFHAPPPEAAGDSTWAEWHYFNVLSPDGGRWLYLTYRVGGDLRGGRWGGRLLATLVDGGRERAFERDVPSDEVDLAPGRVGVRVGAASEVRLEDGAYRVIATVPATSGAGSSDPPRGTSDPPSGPLRVDLTIEPAPHRYLPAIDASSGDFLFGYAVPILRGTARGTVCVGDACEVWSGGRAYHDHNWGVWRDVTWDWGEFQLGGWSILYGGIDREGEAGAPASRPESRVLFALDSLGLAAVLPIRRLEYTWTGTGGPTRMELEAGRGEHVLRLSAETAHDRVTVMESLTGGSNLFFQMRGTATIDGRLPVGEVSAAGDGFFETWRRSGRP